MRIFMTLAMPLLTAGDLALAGESVLVEKPDRLGELYASQSESGLGQFHTMGYATPSDTGMPGEIWGAVKVLQDTYGWTDDEIRGLLGENLLRVYRANWQ